VEFKSSISRGEGTVGIDLAGIERRPTGWAFIKRQSVTFRTLFFDDEILGETVRVSPRVVAIDAPLSLPKTGFTRYVDRQMVKLGYRVLPPLYPAMRLLTKRGIKLSRKLRAREIEVIEVHPRSSMKALSINTRNWKGRLADLGFKIPQVRASEHEVDAIFAAVTAVMYLRGKYERIGDEEGVIILPRGGLE
jgi:hypothetical protein